MTSTVYYAKAPAHTYFIANGLLSWNFRSFCVKLVSGRDEIFTASSAKELWISELDAIARGKHLPKDLKTRILLLKDEGNAEDTLIKSLFRRRQEKSVTECIIRELDSIDEDLRIIAKRVAKRKTEDQSNKKKGSISLSWTKLSQPAWDGSSLLVCDTTSPIEDSDLAMRRVKDRVKSYAIRERPSDDLAEIAHVFRQAVSVAALKSTIAENYTSMELNTLYNQEEEDRVYIRNVSIIMSDMWLRGELRLTSKEGLHLWNLHGPLFSILKAVKYCQVLATDIKLMHGNKDKHDMILRFDGGKFGLDVVCMEAKYHKQPGARLSDMEKIKRTMTGNLNKAIELLPTKIRQSSRQHMRSFGILDSGTRCSLFEVREKGGVAVFYEIGSYEVPTNDFDVHSLVDGMLTTISLKNRVICFIDHVISAQAMQQVKHRR
ncbi:hypothetical protein BGZ49_004130 [Haplosporangium sp. Z 27]|nr:hypothetical protein BGZ49_004130 [Haplosporangium sp. Z 27]